MSKYQIFGCTEEEAEQCASMVKEGSVVVFPTDTIYGIGCDPRNDSAVARVFKIKGRNEKKPLPVLAFSTQDAEKIISLGKSGRILASKFWPGALTIAAPIVDNSISSKVIAGNTSLAVRIPANKCILSLLRHCKYIVGTSANLSGKKSPTSAQQVIDSGLDGFDVLLDGGKVEGGVESTIVDVTGTEPKILREGAIKSAEVFGVLGKV